MLVSERKQSRAGAGVAGAGAGTALVLVANGLHEGHPLKPLLSYAAPSATVLFGVACFWIQREGFDLLHDWRIRRRGNRAKRRFHESLNNPDTSEEHKNAIRKKLEELELVIANRDLQQIEALARESYEEFKKSK